MAVEKEWITCFVIFAALVSITPQIAGEGCRALNEYNEMYTQCMKNPPKGISDVILQNFFRNVESFILEEFEQEKHTMQFCMDGLLMELTCLQYVVQNHAKNERNLTIILYMGYLSYQYATYTKLHHSMLLKNEGVPAAGVTAEGVTAAGVTAEGVTTEGVTTEGVTAKGVTAEGMTDEEKELAKELKILTGFLYLHAWNTPIDIIFENLMRIRGFDAETTDFESASDIPENILILREAKKAFTDLLNPKRDQAGAEGIPKLIENIKKFVNPVLPECEIPDLNTNFLAAAKIKEVLNNIRKEGLLDLEYDGKVSRIVRTIEILTDADAASSQAPRKVIFLKKADQLSIGTN